MITSNRLAPSCSLQLQAGKTNSTNGRRSDHGHTVEEVQTLNFRARRFSITIQRLWFNFTIQRYSSISSNDYKSTGSAVPQVSPASHRTADGSNGSIAKRKLETIRGFRISNMFACICCGLFGREELTSAAPRAGLPRTFGRTWPMSDMVRTRTTERIDQRLDHSQRSLASRTKPPVTRKRPKRPVPGCQPE